MKTRTHFPRAALLLLAAAMLSFDATESAGQTDRTVQKPDGTGGRSGATNLSKQTFTYKRVGDCEIKADVYRLTDTRTRPVILWIHGGALIMGDRNGLRREQLERYVAAGYTVVSIDYRLAPETKLKEIIDDLRDAHAWIQASGPKLFQADPSRLAVIGHSAGGYLTLMAGFCVSPRPKALVPFYGYGDIVGDWYSRPDPFYNRQPAVSREEALQSVGDKTIAEGGGRNRSRFYLYCRQQGLWPKEVAGHDPATDPKAFLPFCPVRNVTKEYPPTLLLHGTVDTDVPYEQSALMAAELKRHGVEHELITMQDRGHGFDGGRDAMKDTVIAQTFDRVVAFLDKHLK